MSTREDHAGPEHDRAEQARTRARSARSASARSAARAEHDESPELDRPAPARRASRARSKEGRVVDGRGAQPPSASSRRSRGRTASASAAAWARARAGTRAAGSRARSPAPGRTRCRAGFEGGQMPIDMRLCRSCGATRRRTRCRSARSARTRQPVNLRDLEARFEAGAEVTPETLVTAKRLIKNTEIDVKILGSGELYEEARRHRAQASRRRAKEKIEAAGGSSRWLRGEPVAKKPKRAKAKRRVTADEAGDVEADEPQSRRGGKPDRVRPRRRPTRCSAGSPTPGASRSSGGASLFTAFVAGRSTGSARGCPAPGVDSAAIDELPLEHRRPDPRPAEPVLGRRAVAVLALRARDHAVRHGLDHPAAHDRRHPAALGAAEGGRGRATPRSTSTRAT